MSFEKARVRDVVVQYGPRKIGGSKGQNKVAGGMKEYIYDYDGDDYPVNVLLPPNATVWDVISTKVTAGAIITATAGGVDISTTTGLEAGTVTLGAGTHELVITGATAGKISVLVEERAA